MFALDTRPSIFTFQPTRPSPLSPRHTNALRNPPRSTTMSPRNFPKPQPPPQQQRSTPHTSSMPFLFTSMPASDSSDDSFTYLPLEPRTQAQTQPRTNPLLMKSDPAMDRVHRRNAFIRKIRKETDDRRHESRSEQLLRLEFLRTRREWEEEQRVRLEGYVGFDEEMVGGADGGMEGEMDMEMEMEMMDDVLVQEDREFQAWVEGIVDVDVDDEQKGEGDGYKDGHKNEDAGQGQGQGIEKQTASMTDYGSDEEDYDRVFMELALRAEFKEGEGERGRDSSPPLGQEQDGERSANHDVDMDMIMD